MHVTAHLDVDVVAVEGDDQVTVMLELEAPAAPDRGQRPEQAAVVVLDRSGSMSGARLAAAKRACVDLIARLDERDSFGLVVFDSSAEVVVPAGRVGDLGRDTIRRAIQSVQTQGMTDMSSGYLRGLQEARRVAETAGVTIILLSDGHANSGIVDPAQFRQMGAGAAAQGITTATIGIGTGYDDEILSELAVGGNGNHTFAEEGDAAAAALAAELTGLLSKTVQAASLFIKPMTSAVDSVAVLNDLPHRTVADGIVVEIGDLYASERRRLLVEIHVPAMPALGLATVAEFQLQYVTIPALEDHTVTLPISVNVVPQDVALGRVPDAEVRRERVLLDVQSAKRSSERAMMSGDITAAHDILGLASGSLASMAAESGGRLSPELAAERDELDEIRRTLHRDVSSAKRISSSSRIKKARGYSSRPQGGTYRSAPRPSQQPRDADSAPDGGFDPDGGSASDGGGPTTR